MMQQDSYSSELALPLCRIAELEGQYAAMLLAAAPRDGSSTGLTDYALQTQFLRGHLAALAALRELLTTPQSTED